MIKVSYLANFSNPDGSSGQLWNEITFEEGRVEALLHKNIICLKPRLERRYGYLVYPEGLTVKAIKEQKNNFWDFVKHGDAEDAHVEVIEDCFDDMERPKFGWRVKVRLMENEPCVVNLENPDLNTCKTKSNSTNADDSGKDISRYGQNAPH